VRARTSPAYSARAVTLPAPTVSSLTERIGSCGACGREHAARASAAVMIRTKCGVFMAVQAVGG
jgi:hypothetical protein